MVEIVGQTATQPYVYGVPGNANYNIVPLLTVGDEVPTLVGTGFSLTPDTSTKYAFAGIPDGLGLFETEDSYFVFVNHELSTSNTSFLNSTDPDQIKGARVSLYQFDKNWNVIGGKNLIETVVDEATGITYELDTTTGLYTSSDGKTFSLDRFCSAYLAEYGFEGGPVYFGPEETDGGRAWAITTDGVAASIDGLGRYAYENIVAASQYRADNSDKTVLIATEDEGDGEVYMWVGNQTADDPNGFDIDNGDLYILKVNGFEWETIPESEPAIATWVKVPKDIVLKDTDGSLLSAFANAAGNSTNFRRPEDIHEDPNNPGTFYFVTTGRNEKLGSLTERAATPAEADNPYGKLYRFTLNPNDPTGAMNLEMVLEGGPGRGISYDNMVVDRNGKVLIQEDVATSFAADVMLAEGRDNAYIMEYDIATDTVRPLFQADESITSRNTASPGQWETSGIIEVPGGSSGRSAYLFDVQAHSILDSRYVQGGQLLLAVPVAANSQNLYISGAGNDAVNGTDTDDTIDGGEGDNTLYGNGGDDILYAGNGDDIAYAEGGDDIFFLGNGDNTVFANGGDDRVSTGNGDDLIYADAGDDIITAGSGDNVVYARQGNNRVLTGAGNDHIWAANGNDIISAGAGNDTIYVSGGNNVIDAGTGVDKVVVGWENKGTDTFALNAGVGSVTIFGFSEMDKFSLGSSLKVADLTIAIAGNDTTISKGSDLLATLKWTHIESINVA